jgi:hypothetical protein
MVVMVVIGGTGSGCDGGEGWWWWWPCSCGGGGHCRCRRRGCVHGFNHSADSPIPTTTMRRALRGTIATIVWRKFGPVQSSN